MEDKGFLTMDSPLEPPPNLRMFTFLVGTFEFFGIVALLLAAIWLGNYQGGFAWGPDDAKYEFNYHPLLMIIAFCFIHGNANIIYRLLRHDRKIRLKVIHGSLQLLAFLFMVVALQAVFDSHNYAKEEVKDENGKKTLQPHPHPNMFSLHSWIGLSTVILYCCQWVTGFTFFLFPKVSLHLRRNYLPIHVFFGSFIHILFISTALMGLSEKAAWSVADWHEKGPEGRLVNMLGVVLVLFGLNGVYLLMNPNFKRQPRPDDDGAYIPRD